LFECNAKIPISCTNVFYAKCGTITTLQDIWPHCDAAIKAKPSKMFSTEEDS
jgi:hypothetical protein